VEILRFGPGSRRPRGGPGAHGLAEQAIWSDQRVRVTELSFGPRAVLPPQSSPQHGLFIVVSGGGWVQVGDERAAVNHGEAVEWPALLSHGAWTNGAHMRAILVELRDDALEPGSWSPGTVIPATGGVPVRSTEDPPARPAAPPGSAGSSGSVTAARGRLAERHGRPEDHDPTEGEPW
jgi:quercetin dioxygenase-like cupin family protein